MLQVALKRTHKLEPFDHIASRAFRRQLDMATVGTIANGNTAEILREPGKEKIFCLGTGSEIDTLRRRHRRDGSRILEIDKLDSSGVTLVDVDSMPLPVEIDTHSFEIPRFDREVVQHWANRRGSSIYFDQTFADRMVVDKGALIAPYLVLSRLKDLIDHAFVNIVKNGEKPKDGSKESIERALTRSIGKNISVTGYDSGVRYYDIIITIFGNSTISQQQIKDRLVDAPRIVTMDEQNGMHNTLELRVEAIRNGNTPPPIIACIGREPPSTMQVVKLSTDLQEVIALANVDAVRVINGASVSEAMKLTDTSLRLHK